MTTPPMTESETVTPVSEPVVDHTIQDAPEPVTHEHKRRAPSARQIKKELDDLKAAERRKEELAEQLEEAEEREAEEAEALEAKRLETEYCAEQRERIETAHAMAQKATALLPQVQALIPLLKQLQADAVVFHNDAQRGWRPPDPPRFDARFLDNAQAYWDACKRPEINVWQYKAVRSAVHDLEHVAGHLERIRDHGVRELVATAQDNIDHADERAPKPAPPPPPRVITRSYTAEEARAKGLLRHSVAAVVTE